MRLSYERNRTFLSRVAALAGFLLCLAVAPQLSAQAALVPTFECMGIQLPFPAGVGVDSVCHVSYRASGSSFWREGHDLWTDVKRNLFVGSVVYLEPGTTYEFRLTVEDGGSQTVIDASGTTWNEKFPIGQRQVATNRSAPMTISTSGTPTGYFLFAPTDGERARFDVGISNDEALVIDADYVIVRDIDFVGGLKNVIRIADRHSDIVIENCTFTSFGAIGKANGPNTFPDERDNAAILVGNNWSGSGVKRVVVQRCDFYKPNGGSNSWDQGHPTGPHAIYLLQTLGNHVIRYNRIHSVSNRWYNDGIGGGSNASSEFGNVNCDTDIYGNIVSQCWDDAIEVEGRDENVRVWGNFIRDSSVGVASGAVTVGPLYVFRNVIMESYASESDPGRRGTAFKTGHNLGGVQGPQYTYNNTITGPHECMNAIGAAAGPIVNHTSRNNIFDVTGSPVYDGTQSTSNDFDYDLLRSGANLSKIHSGNYANALYGTPTYTADGPYGGTRGHFLQASSPGYRGGTRIPNFGDTAAGTPLADPSVGAFDERMAPLAFGHGRPIPSDDVAPAPPSNVTVVNP